MLSAAPRQLAPGSRLVYRPALLGSARVHFAQGNCNRDVWQLLWEIDQHSDRFEWDSAPLLASAPETDAEPDPGAAFDPLPRPLSQPKTYSGLESALKDSLYRNNSLTLWRSRTLKDVSAPGESKEDFLCRLEPRLKEIRQRDRLKFWKQVLQTIERVFKTALPVILLILRSKDGGSSRTKGHLSGADTGRRSKGSGRVAGTDDMAAIASTPAANEISQIVGAAAEALNKGGGAHHRTRDDGSMSKALATGELPPRQNSTESQPADEFGELEAINVRPKKSDITVSSVVLVWAPYAAAKSGEGERLFDIELKAEGA